MLYAILFMASFWCNWCSFESFPSLNGCIWGFRRWMKATTSQTVFFPDQLKWEGAYWVEETFYLLNGLTMRLVWLLSKDLSPKQNCQLNLYISTVMSTISMCMSFYSGFLWANQTQIYHSFSHSELFINGGIISVVKVCHSSGLSPRSSIS